jgi:sorting nexin-41/42
LDFSRALEEWSLMVVADLTQDHSELGAALNGFSLNETGQLSTAIEKTGQAVDATYMSTAKLVSPSFMVPYSSQRVAGLGA